MTKNIFVRKPREEKTVGQSGPASFFLATVASVSSTDGVTIIPDGQTEAVPKYYKILTGSGTLAAEDRVVVMRPSGTCIILGKIGTAPESGGGGDESEKVDRSGDTMTGDLIMADSNLSIDDPEVTLGTRPEANHWTKQFRIRDAVGNVIAKIRAVCGANGLSGVQLYGHNIVDGATVNNYLGLYMSDAGTATVEMNQPAAWRKALGLGNTNGALPITAAQGGTGVTTAGVNRVFAGPSSGSASAAPSFRTLVDADLPTIAVSKGGTGVSTAGANRVFAGPSSGGNGAPAFRTLVSDDLPIVPVEKGGAGSAQVSTTRTIADVATAATGYQITSVSYAQWGKVAYLRITARATAAHTANTWNTIATIVSGKRPAVDIIDYLHNSSNMQISGGSLQYYGPITSGQEFRLVATYLLA